jgi:hypothetical protein
MMLAAVTACILAIVDPGEFEAAVPAAAFLIRRGTGCLCSFTGLWHNVRGEQSNGRCLSSSWRDVLNGMASRRRPAPGLVPAVQANKGVAMNHVVLYFTFLIVLSLLISGCCEQISIFPAGAYVATIGGESYVLDFECDGRYTAVLAGGELLADSTYRVTPDTITFSADSTCQEAATYSWARQGERLTFELRGEDSCSQRRERLQDAVYNCVSCS